jgi:acyl-CoA thioesterase I
MASAYEAESGGCTRLGPSHASTRALWLALALAALFTPPAVAEPVAVPPPISKECQAPGTNFEDAVPLPNVAAALETRRTIRILAIGASSTGGPGARRGPTAEIEQLLEKAIAGLDVEIINRGVSGELAEAAAERLKGEVAVNHPDLVLWQVGTMDALAQVPVHEFTNTVTSTIRWLREHKVDVALVGLQYLREMKSDPQYQAMRHTLQRIADSEKVLRIGRYEATEIMQRVQASDGAAQDEFALAEASSHCVAQYVARAITAGLFLKKPPLRAPPK